MIAIIKRTNWIMLLSLFGLLAPEACMLAGDNKEPEVKAAEVVMHARKETVNSFSRMWRGTTSFASWLSQLPNEYPLLGQSLAVAIGILAVGAMKTAVVGIAGIVGYKKAKHAITEKVKEDEEQLKKGVEKILTKVPHGNPLYKDIENLLNKGKKH